MELREFGPDDRELLRAFVEVTNAVRAADSPWVHPMTEREADGNFRHGWDGEPGLPFVALVDGVPVGCARYHVSMWDNQHLAWLDVSVHPACRRRGHGTAMLEAMVGRARGEGRTSVGIDGWESGAVTGFAARHGLDRKAVEVNRRQFTSDLDRERLDRLFLEAQRHADGYELVRRLGRTPDAELEAVARMASAINDAPTDDLDVEDEVFTAERIRNYEEAQLAREAAMHRVLARHRDTGELAGQSVVAVDGERPHLAGQHDTSVVRTHRGHRLGLLLKLDMLRWLLDEQPQVESIDTWNAASNDHMIGVNEALGYRVMGTALAFQRSL